MTSFKVALVTVDIDMPDWVPEAIAKEGIEFVIRECETKEELAETAGDADLVWVFGGGLIIGPDHLDHFDVIPNCGAVIRSGSGTDNIAVEEATKRGIIVANTPAATEEEVSDHAIGLLFAVIRQIGAQDRLIRSGVWDCYRGFPLWQTRGKTLGLVGFGHIARCLIEKMRGFEQTVLVYDPFVDAEEIARHHAQAASLDDVMSQSDWVSVHCPLLPGTHHLIGERELRLMKKTAILVNTARGPVIDEPALVRSLQEGWIAGAGLDVFEEEPVSPDNPLLKLDNTVLTPHIAGYSDMHHHNFWALSVETAIAFARGHWPRSFVNHDVKPRWDLS